MFYPSSCFFGLGLPQKRLCCLVAVLSWLDDITGRPLIQIIAGLPFGNLSNDRHVFDKFTQAISSQE